MRKQGLKSEAIMTFTSSLHILLKAGIPLQEGFAIMLEDSHTEHQMMISKLQKDMEEGHTLAYALAQTDVFPNYMISMVEVGEECGCLDQVMDSLSSYYERISNMKQQLQNAITYPCILFIMMFFVVGVLVFKVLPIFQNVLHALGSELTSFALTFMKIGNAFAQIGFLCLGILLLTLFILWLRFAKFGKTKGWSSIFARLFFTKKMYLQLSMAQMTYVFSLFFSSGADVEQAFLQLNDMELHPELKTRLNACTAAMKQGNDFTTAMRSSKLYQGMEANMLEIGYRSGTQDQVMRQLANRYEDNVEQAIVAFLNIIEPTIVALLSVLVGLILLSVMLPLMGIMSSVG